MAKGFKRRICRVIIATLQSCRSKDPSDLQENPVSSISRSLNSSDQNHGRRCRASSEFISMGATACGLPSNKQTRSQEFKWQKEEKWHVVGKISEHPTPRRKICSSTEDDPSFEPQAPPPSAADERKIRVEKKKNKVKNNVPSRLRVSTSSPESGWFSSEGGIAADDERDEEETKTLVSSSLSFSTDSSLSTTELSHTRRIKKSRVSKRANRRIPEPPPPTAEVDIRARLSIFKKLIPGTVDGKMKENFAIVKRSEDP